MNTMLSLDQRRKPSGRRVFATFDDSSVVMYMALAPDAAELVMEFNAIVAVDGARMLWLSPGFVCTGYRSRWARAPGRERVLACHFQREVIATLLAKSVPARFDPAMFETQRAWRLATRYTVIRHDWIELPKELGGGEEMVLGVRGDMLKSFAGDWLLRVDDVTAVFTQQHAAVDGQRWGEILAPVECELTVAPEIHSRMGLE
jgi:hypothetical protein